MTTTSILLSLAVALLAGLLLSRLVKIAKLPAVTAYLIAGIIIGPFLIGALNIDGFGFNSLEHVESFSILSDLALGFIAFSIGNEFRLSQLRKIGKQATIVGILQAVFTTVVVDVFLVILHLFGLISLPAALVLGAIAAATAPAATLMVVKQYKAKGPVTDILLPVVALDDAVGLVIFAISFGVARTLSATGGAVNVLSIILEPIIEVVLSLLLGIIVGLLFTLTERFFHSRSKRLAVSVTFVMITVAISLIDFHEIEEAIGLHIAISPLLACMMLGTVFCNTCDFSEELMDRVDRWTSPLFILFFVLSGAELNFEIFGNVAVIIVGIVYIITRSAGKLSGAFISSKMAGCDDNIVKYLGITLLPQAGVALGMASQAVSLGADGELVRSITLFAVLVYEIVGPFLTKIALTKAGDIKPEGKTSARKEAMEQLSMFPENGTSQP